jgi:hypothetical protein
LNRTKMTISDEQTLFETLKKGLIKDPPKKNYSSVNGQYTFS